MELDLHYTSEQINVHFSTPKNTDNEVISFKECKEHFAKYDLDDRKIKDIKNNIEGIVNSIIGSYLETFK